MLAPDLGYALHSLECTAASCYGMVRPHCSKFSIERHSAPNHVGSLEVETFYQYRGHSVFKALGTARTVEPIANERTQQCLILYSPVQ